MKYIRLGIIGYGKMGQIRRKAVEKRNDTVIVAICDPFSPTDEPSHKIDWKECLAQDGLHAVIVSTTNDISPEIVIAALERGLHVFCEKPPGRTVEDIVNIRHAEQNESRPILKFGFNHRYHGSVMAARQIADQGRLGRLLTMRGVYGKAGGAGYRHGWRNDFTKSGGGILIDQGIHMIDLMHFFAGPFKSIKSIIGDCFWTGLGVEDNAMALLRSETGVMAMLHSSATQWKQTFRLELGYEKGYLSLDGILSASMGYAPETLTIGTLESDSNGDPVANPQTQTRTFAKDDSFDLEITEFINAIKGNGAIHTGTSQQALDAMNTLHRIYTNDHDFTHKTRSVE